MKTNLTIIFQIFALMILLGACSAENPISNDVITQESLERNWKNFSEELKNEYGSSDVTTIKEINGLPQIVGGMAAIGKKIKYSQEAIANNVEGRVVVEFFVNELGNVVDASIVRGIGYGCDESALLAITSTKFEVPNTNGQPIRYKMAMPIVFKLK